MSMHDSEVDRSEGDVNRSPLRRKWSEGIGHAKTKELLELDERYFYHQSLSTPCLDVIASSSGSTIENLEGKRYYDFHGNSVHQVGYGHESVVAAIKEQLDTLPFCPRRFTNEKAARLAEKLAQLAPGDLSKVLFAPGGSLAIGMAMKIARRVTGRFKTISWWDSFHGASLDAVSIGGERIFRGNIGPLLPGCIHVPPPSPPGDASDSASASAFANADYVEYVMEKEGDIAAFIAEPIRWTSVYKTPASYWKRVRELCDKYGALLIFDEIPTCLGRTGRMFACEHYDVVPDLLVIGKGLGGGIFPIAAVIGKPEFDVAKDVALGHYTHEKSSVGAAAALATIGALEHENALENVARIEKLMVKELERVQSSNPLVRGIRSIGLLIGIEVWDESSERSATRAEAIFYECLAQGLSFKVSQGNILTLAPPLNLSIEEAMDSMRILEQAIHTVSSRLDK